MTCIVPFTAYLFNSIAKLDFNDDINILYCFTGIVSAVGGILLFE